MSSKIRVLSDLTINKIAAGEVVENPASVVKELIENALDAGSTEICIEIKGGGRQLIRVSDNGCGMSSDDALLCLERHATSKIRDIEDIYALQTMGFRGEAIPSIAAISKFTLLTCLQKEGEKNQEGTLITVEGGKLLSSSPATRSPGTTIEVKSLFFNIPVRKKFQKSPAYDTQEILKVVSLLALGYPAIQFELVSDQKSLFKTSMPLMTHSFSEQLGQRMESALGREFFTSTCPISFQKSPYQLTGFIGLPAYHRHNRTGQYLFINQRAVYSPFISFAIKEGYGTTLPLNRHPVFVLHLDMPGSLVDINVHPQKKEVRLRQETYLKESLVEAIQIGLKNQGFSQETVDPFQPSYASLLSPPFTVAEDPGAMKMMAPHWPASSSPSFASPLSSPNIWQNAAFYVKETDYTPSSLFDLAPVKSSPRVLATIKGYIILDAASLNMHHFSGYKGQDGMYLVDQKRAHTRIHYERFLKNLTDNAPHSTDQQALLIPFTCDFSPLEAIRLKDHLPLLNKMGFGIQEFGENSFIIDSVPQVVKKEHIQDCLTQIIQDLQEEDTKRIQREKEKQMALAASRASLPSTAHLSFDEAQALLNQLFECETPLQCPFGRPIMAYLAPEELTKYF